MVQVKEGFQIVPSISIGERYDTNVFFIPKTAGLDRSDFVTTAAPQVRGLYAGSLVNANIMVGAIGEYYAKNTGFNYVGVNTGLALDASKLVSQWREGARLTVTDTYTYTPQPPSFVTGDVDGEGTNPFVRGFQVGRVNFQSNNLGITTSVPISQTLNANGTYSNGFVRFGKSEVQQVGNLLDTNYQSYSAGLALNLTRQDIIKMNFTGSEFSSPAQGDFTTRGGTVGWSHQFNPTMTVNSAAGLQLLEGESNGRQLTPTLAPQGNLTLLLADRTTTLTLAYALAVTPTYQFESQALLTHTASLTLTQMTEIPGLVGLLNLNYGVGDQYGSKSASSVSYSSYGGTAGFLYKITPQTFLSLNYSYSRYDNQFGGQDFSFDRSVVQMTLSQAFY